MGAPSSISEVRAVDPVAQSAVPTHSPAVERRVRNRSPERPEPPPTDLDVARTPRRGLGITHRVAVILRGAVTTGGWAAKGSVRAGLEPATEAWVASLLPDPAAVGCTVELFDKDDTTLDDVVVALADLGLAALDFVFTAVPGEAAESSEIERPRRPRRARDQQRCRSCAASATTVKGRRNTPSRAPCGRRPRSVPFSTRPGRCCRRTSRCRAFLVRRPGSGSCRPGSRTCPRPSPRASRTWSRRWPRREAGTRGRSTFGPTCWLRLASASSAPCR